MISYLLICKCDQNPQETTNLVTFTEEVLSGQLHVFSSDPFDYPYKPDAASYPFQHLCLPLKPKSFKSL